MHIFRSTLITLLLLLLQPVDFSGTWQGTATVSMPDGTKDILPILAYFRQDGLSVTGSLGPDEGDQHPISGTVKDNKLAFTIPQPGGNIAIELTSADRDHLKGVGRRAVASETAIVELSRKGVKD